MKNKKVSITAFVLLAGIVPGLNASIDQAKVAALQVLSKAGSSVAKMMSSQETIQDVQKHVAGEIGSFAYSCPEWACFGLYGLQVAAFYKGVQIDQDPKWFVEARKNDLQAQCAFKWDFLPGNDTARKRAEAIISSFHYSACYTFKKLQYLENKGSECVYMAIDCTDKENVVIYLSGIASIQINSSPLFWDIILKHELAHVIYGHQKIFRTLQYRSFAVGVITLTVAAGSFLLNSVTNDDFKSFFQILSPAGCLVFFSLFLMDRESFIIKPQELQADAFAYRYTGTNELQTYVESLKKLTDSTSKSRWKQLRGFWYSTHSSGSESIRMIEAELARRSK